MLLLCHHCRHATVAAATLLPSCCRHHRPRQAAAKLPPPPPPPPPPSCHHLHHAAATASALPRCCRRAAAAAAAATSPSLCRRRAAPKLPPPPPPPSPVALPPPPPLPPPRYHRCRCRDATKLLPPLRRRQADTATAPPGEIRKQLFPTSSLSVDEHAKLKAKMKTKQSSQPRNPSPTCVSQVTWKQVSLIPDESHKESNKGRSEGSHKDKGCDWRGSAIP
jgi:hypothetical protein